ncbi:MAG: 30S ribosomal protein S1 [Zetaproteobacteria bacterium]|nr:MAG: 30S ribosomal protein S1 [Zetaproteobacteria bacterium]
MDGEIGGGDGLPPQEPSEEAASADGAVADLGRSGGAPRTTATAAPESAADDDAHEADREEEEGGEEDAFRALFEESLRVQTPLDRGRLVEGVVVGFDGDLVIIDVGAKGEGAVPADEFSRLALPLPERDARVEVMITGFGADGVRLSVLEAHKQHQWERVEAALADGGTVEARVLRAVKGGFRVSIGGLEAFMPRSEADVSRFVQPEALIGNRYPVAVLEASRKPENVVVSHRRPLEAEQAARRARFFADHKVGDRVTGVVRRLVDFGAFVDLGGVDALLHVSDIAWRRLSHPSEALSPGQTITAEIRALDAEAGKVSISMRALQEDPWTRVAGSYARGMRVTGTVRKLLDYGAVVELEPGVDGLIHRSEMSWTRQDVKPSSLLSEGDVVDLAVLDVDVEKRRIRLSIKEVLENPWQAWLADHPVGSRVRGRVKNITDFGFFVGLTEELDGLVHIGNLTWKGDGAAALSDYHKGQEVECVVLGVDVERQRISLGIKQLSDDPFVLFLERAGERGRVTGRVVEAAAWGYLLEVAEGVRARLPRRELPKGQDPLEIGTEVEAKIVGVDRKRREVELSVRQLLRDEEREAIRHYRSVQESDETPSPLALELQRKLKGKLL